MFEPTPSHQRKQLTLPQSFKHSCRLQFCFWPPPPGLKNSCPPLGIAYGQWKRPYLMSTGPITSIPYPTPSDNRDATTHPFRGWCPVDSFILLDRGVCDSLLGAETWGSRQMGAAACPPPPQSSKPTEILGLGVQKPKPKKTGRINTTWGLILPHLLPHSIAWFVSLNDKQFGNGLFSLVYSTEYMGCEPATEWGLNALKW